MFLVAAMLEGLYIVMCITAEAGLGGALPPLILIAYIGLPFGSQAALVYPAYLALCYTRKH